MPSLRDRLRALFASPPALATGEVAVANTRISVNKPVSVVYNPDDLARRRGAYVLYDEMRYDEQVKACLALKVAAVVGPGWRMDPVDRRNETEAAFAEELKDQLDGVTGTFSRALVGILGPALRYGFSLSEIVLDADPDLRLKKLKTVAPYDIEFEIDPFGNVTAIKQRGMGEEITIPTARVVHFVHEPEFGNPYGQSDLKAAHRNWWHKKHWVQWWSIWGEKFADAPVIATHPAQTSVERVNEVLSDLDRLQARTSVGVPEGWVLDTLEGKRDPKAVFEGAINRHDLAIAKAILIPEKMGLVGGEDGGGSYALSKTHLGAFFFIVDLLKQDLESAVQEQVVVPLAQMFAPSIPTPKFRINELTEDNRTELAAAFIAAISGQAIKPGYEDDKWFRDVMGMPDLTEDEYDQRKEEAKAEAAEIAAQAMGPEDEEAPAKEEKEEFAQRRVGLLPTRAVAERHDVPKKFSRPLTFIEQRADMAEKKRTFEELTPKVGTNLATGSLALVEHIKAQVRRKGLAQPNASVADILALTAPKGLLNAMRAQFGLDLIGAYDRGAKEAKGEVRRAKARKDR